MGPGNCVYIRRCSHLWGVHNERFHCIRKRRKSQPISILLYIVVVVHSSSSPDLFIYLSLSFCLSIYMSWIISDSFLSFMMADFTSHMTYDGLLVKSLLSIRMTVMSSTLTIKGLREWKGSCFHQFSFLFSIQIYVMHLKLNIVVCYIIQI